VNAPQPSWNFAGPATLDAILAVLAGGVALGAFLHWSIRLRRDPLGGAPPRPHEVREDSVLFCVCAYLLGAAGLGAVGQFIFDGNEDLRTRMITGNGAHLVGAVACLLAGARAFGGGLRTFLFGGSGITVRTTVLCVAAASIVGVVVCPLIAEATIQGIQFFDPEKSFAPHPTLEALRGAPQATWVRVGLWLGAGVVAPLAEELFFRGLLQTYAVGLLRRRWTAIVLTSIVFGLVHASQPQTVVALIVFGVLLGYVYESTGAILPPLAVHALFNLKTLLWEQWTRPPT